MSQIQTMKFIAEISVLGFTPVPWTVPHFGSGMSKSGKKFHFQTRTRKSRPENLSPDLEHWQKLIRDEAIMAMNEDPYTELKLPRSCPISLTITFVDRPLPGNQYNQIWFPGIKQNAKGEWVKLGNHEPDLTNLVKAVEDALQGVVYHNDFQVRMQHAEMRYGYTPGVIILVQEIEESDFPGLGEPVETAKPKKRRSSVAIPAKKAGKS